jgi:hypothetical protein
MITLGREPEGMVVTRGDVLAWLPGLSRERWKKIRPTLREIYVPGGARPAYSGQRPHYYKAEIRRVLVEPMLEQPAA